MIVVGTAAGRSAWLTGCLASLPHRHVLAVYRYEYEIGKLRWVTEFHPELTRFWFLQDTVVVHDTSFLADALDHEGSVPLCNDPAPFGMFMGVYERDVLLEVGLPEVTDKRHAIRLEIEWTRRYWDAAGRPPALFPELRDANAVGVEHRHGRDNLVLRNEYLTKYKGTWH